jgi:cell division control protein 6
MEDDPGNIEQPTFSIQEELQSERETVFKDKSLLRSDKIVDEDRIVGRDHQLKEVIRILKPALYDDVPEDMLLHGPSGTGKSLIVGVVSKQLVTIAQDNGQSIGVVEINGRQIKSEDKAVYHIVTQLATAAGVDADIPKKGISTTYKYDRLYEIIGDHIDIAIIVLDELDLLWGRGRSDNDDPAFSDLLYNLTRSDRIGGLDGQLSVAGLTNNATALMGTLDSRTDSTFGPEQILFPDYGAGEIRDILTHRRDAFNDDVLDHDVIPKAAAYGAQGDGDARKAIDLLRSAGNIADREGSDTVTIDHLDKAQEAVERQYTISVVETVTIQKKAILLAAALVDSYSDKPLSGVPAPIAYTVYQFITDHRDMMDQRSEDSALRWMREFDTMGVIERNRVGRGPDKGVHVEYQFGNDSEIIIETITDTESRFEHVINDTELIRTLVNTNIRDFFID